MKGEKREIYRVLVDQVDAQLCTFCKYAEWGGGCDVECECKHPLWRVSDTEYDHACDGGDCWGFRPSLKLDDIVDIVGLILSNHFTQWYYEMEDNRPKLYGQA